MGLVRRHLTYANVAATLALLFAMSGGAFAATHYLINSTKQINPKVLKALKGTEGGSGSNGANGSAGAAGSAGQNGAQGSSGAQGSPGPAGATGGAGPEGQAGKEGPPGPEGKAGSWTALVLGSKVEPVSGFEPPAVRTENGGSTVRLRGVLVVTNEIANTSDTVFTVPVGYRPKSKIEFGLGVSTASGMNHVGSLLIAPNGVVTDPETHVPAGTYYLLDGLSFNLN
jgi:hypothetical protein